MVTTKIKDMALSFALLLISVVIAILLAEFAVRVIDPQNLSGSWRIATDKGLMVNKSQGTSQHQFGDQIVKYTFHEPNLRDTPIRADGKKVLVVGDSFTFGWLLNKEDTFVHLLQTYADKEFGVSKFQFLNAAAGGWGTSDYVAYIDDFGELIDPDIILVFINTDDIGRSVKKNYQLTLDKGSYDLKRKHMGYSKLKQIVNRIPGYELLLENSHLMQLTRVAILRTEKNSNSIVNQESLDKEANVGPSSTKASVSRVDAISLGTGLFSHLDKWVKNRTKQLWVTTTGFHSLEDRSTVQEPTKAFMSSADQLFESRRIPFVDISEYMAAEFLDDRGKYTIQGDGHPNEMGAQLIANTSWQHFIREQLSEYCRITKSCT